MTRLALYLLGPPRIERGGEPVRVGRRKVMALLAYLAVTGAPHSRDTLATLLSPGFDQAGARADLRRTLSLLNCALGKGGLMADRETVGLNAEAGPSVDSGRALWLDVETFRGWLAECGRHRHPLAEVCADCVPPLEAAVGVNQGDFMAGFTLPDILPFEEWQRFETEALRRELASALERLVRGLGAQDDYEAAIPHAQRWLELNLTDEPAHRALMELYARTGQTSVALHQYEYCVQALAEELGVPPSAETRALYERVRAGQATQLHSVASSQVQHTAEVPHNLPPQLTPIIGREAELAELDKLIAARDVRLITIVGPGGIGKTRLALAAAKRQLNQPADSRVTEFTDSQTIPFPDGVCFVPLARLNSPDQMVSALAEALGFRFERGSSRTPEQQLLGFLREKQMVLVLDNLEHLLGASPPQSLPSPLRFAGRSSPTGETPFGRGGAELVADILEAAPAIGILATSRERLQLREEQVYAIQGLDYLAEIDPDDLGEIVDTAAARLFLQSAGRARHDLALAADDVPTLARICRLVDGMPLALELAASWVDTLSLAEIGNEIGRGLDALETEWRDVPERHRSVRAAFDASWRHLGSVEREVFAQLSVFRGGFTRGAARAVVDTGTGVPLSYRILARLVNKSLLHYSQTHDRYDVHELLRQYGTEKLGERTSDTRDRHSAHYNAALERWGKDLHGARQAAALDEIAGDLENVRNAWGWAAARGDVARLDQALEGYSSFFWRQSTHQDSIAQFQLAIDALGQVDATAPDFADAQRVLARATIRQAYSYWAVGRRTLSKTLLRRAEKLLDGPVLHGHDTRRERALLYHRMGQLAQALPLYRSLGDRASEGWCLMDLGLYEECLAIHQALENHQGVAFALFVLGNAAHRRGDLVQAKRLLGDSLASFRASHSANVLDALERLANVHRDSGDYEAARQMYEESLAGARAQGYLRAGVHASQGLGALAFSTYDVDEARRRFKDSLALSQEYGDSRYSAPALAALGRVALLLGESEACLDDVRQSLSVHRECGNLDAVAMDLGSLGVAHWLSAAFDAANAAIQEGLAIARERQQGRITAILILVQCQFMMCVARYAQAAARAGGVLALVHDEWVEALHLPYPDVQSPYSYLYTQYRISCYELSIGGRAFHRCSS